MKIEKKTDYTLLTTEENSLQEVLKSLNNNILEKKAENIFLVISDNLNITCEDFSLFLDTAVNKKENGTSFVIISTSCNIDELPEEINIVPTLQEAEDVLEMENIERELGF